MTPEQRFATFGPLVDVGDVPRLVEDGRTIWSWAYDDESDEFSTIERDDLWLFYDDLIAADMAWGPFRLGQEIE